MQTQTPLHQFSSVAQSCLTLRPQELQHPRLPCSSPTPRAYSNSCQVFSKDSVLRIRRPKYWSFSFSISPSNEHSGLISFRIDLLDLLAVQRLSRVFSNITVQKLLFLSAQLALYSNSHIHT